MRSATSAASALLALALIVIAGALVLYAIIPFENYAFQTSPSDRSSTTTITVTSPSPTGSSSSSTSGNATGPVIQDGTVKLTFPSDYATIVNFTLNQINSDRAKFGLSPVTVSPIVSGQQHADSMLYFGYFSHWDTQDFKPYVRYTLLNGTGAVEENVAYEYTSAPSFSGTSDAEQAISKLEFQMLYNDSSCCQNGHRDNILDPLHNRVSLGIAYNSTRVYLVEDFENYYLQLGQPFLGRGNTVTLAGNSTYPLGNAEVLVFFDNHSQALTTQQLSRPPYAGSYNQGTFLGGVVPPCVFSCLNYPGYITVTAQKWTVNPNSIQMQFQLDSFIQASGSGIYTVYIEQQGQKNPIVLFDASFILG